MLTSNYWALKGYADTNSFPTGSQYPPSTLDLNLGMARYNYDYQTRSAAIFSFILYSSNNRFDNHIASGYHLQLVPKINSRLVLGSGTTAPTLDDYLLESPLDSSISNYVSTMVGNGITGGTSTVYTATGTNSSGSTITINEIGIVKDGFFPGSGMGVDSISTLLLREVLTEGIEVPSGQGFSITFEWLEQ